MSDAALNDDAGQPRPGEVEHLTPEQVAAVEVCGFPLTFVPQRTVCVLPHDHECHHSAVRS